MTPLEANTTSVVTGGLLVVTLGVLFLRSHLTTAESSEDELRINKVSIRDAIITGFLCLFFLLVPLTSFMTVGQGGSGQASNVVANTIMSDILLIGIGLVVMIRRKSTHLVLNEESWLTLMKNKAYARLYGTVGLVLLSAFVFIQFYSLSGCADFLAEFFEAPILQDSVTMLSSGSGAVPITIALSAVFIAPVVEELCFRGFIYPILKQGTNRWIAAILSSLIFGMAHASIVHCLPLAFLGFVLAWGYERSKSISVPIMTHAVFNFLTVIQAFLLPLCAEG